MAVVTVDKEGEMLERRAGVAAKVYWLPPSSSEAGLSVVIYYFIILGYEVLYVRDGKGSRV